MYDIISIGDSTVDVFLELDKDNDQCELKKDERKLCVNYAGKIPVKSIYRVDASGNAANNAIGMSRLGFHTALWSVIGGDEIGTSIIRELKKEKISTAYIVKDKKKGNNYSTVIDYKGERTILAYHAHREYKWKRISPAKWIYFTSMGSGSEILNVNLLKYAKRTGARLAMNPGTYQLRLDKKILAKLFLELDVLFVNKEEAKRILHDENENDISTLLSRLKSLGPKMVVITNGQSGSYGFDGITKYFLKIFESPVIERTGCGDAYASGFLAAFISGCDVKEAMRWGSVNAAGVIQHIGAHEGLKTKPDIEHILSKHNEYQPVII